ncbi:hypothetical protein M9H77_12530 [Catharanthus roseus]|uniref:Uncharacterized protein n=1 Tax=Catharanthus roseus TaxID=4058 RepID=A0ACC0BHL5_CATRO|nr:hypothetical protein M9H77_12530 [Catharanthus roseus]
MPEDAKESPEEMASNFTSAMFETPQAVLRDARPMGNIQPSWLLSRACNIVPNKLSVLCFNLIAGIASRNMLP